MRRIGTKLAFFELSATSTPRPYVCRKCARQSAAPFSTSSRKPAQDRSRPEVKEATNWEQLEWIGTQRWLDSFMQPRNPLRTFSPTPITRDPEVLKDHVLKAIAEAFLIPKRNTSVKPARPEDIHWPAGVHISFDSADLRPTISFASPEDEASVLKQLGFQKRESQMVEDVAAAKQTEVPSIPAQENAADVDPVADSESAVASESTTAQTIVKETFAIEAAGDGWMGFSMQDPATKFKIVKRVIERTGIKLPDPFIQQCATAGELYNRLLEKPKPRKLAHIIQVDPKLTTLQNVQLHRHRITEVTKDRAVGRWKVIQRELAERGLPEFGALKADQGRKIMRWRSSRYKKDFVWKPAGQ